MTPLKAQSAACFQFVLRMLAEGNSSLPEGGMQVVKRKGGGVPSREIIGSGSPFVPIGRKRPQPFWCFGYF